MKKYLFILVLAFTYHATLAQGWRLDLTSELSSFKYELESLKKDTCRKSQNYFLYRVRHDIHGLLQDSIKKYSEEILTLIGYKSQWPKDKGSIMDCPEVFGMLDLPDSIKQFALADSCTPLHVKARLGDKKAERQVIKEFKKLIKLNRLDTIVGIDDVLDAMLYVRSAKTIKYYLKGFKSKGYWYSSRYECNKSLVFWMMWKFTEYYKCDPIKELFRAPDIICTDFKNMRMHPDAKVQIKAFEKYGFRPTYPDFL